MLISSHLVRALRELITLVTRGCRGCGIRRTRRIGGTREWVAVLAAVTSSVVGSARKKPVFLRAFPAFYKFVLSNLRILQHPIQHSTRYCYTYVQWEKKLVLG